MTGLVRELERCSARAWPSAETFDVQGWECRFASGYTGRANSVNPYGPFTGSVPHAIDRCESLFRERELRPLFRLTPVVDPPDLEAELDRRGYVPRSETRVLVREPGPLPPRRKTPLLETEIREAVTDDWLQCLSKWTGIPPEREALHRRLLDAIRPEGLFATVRSAGVPVAAGLGVLDPPWVGLFDLATAPAFRRRGFGMSLLGSLLVRAAEGGGTRAYLQVVAGNGPAESWYALTGFREAYRYRYRVSTEDSPWRDPKAP